MKKINLLFVLFFPLLVFCQEDKKVQLESKLVEVLQIDQSIRHDLNEIRAKYAGKPELEEKSDSLIAQMLKIDKENQLFIANLLDLKGWPSDLSPQGNMAIFMVIQHGEPEYMDKYAPIVDDAYAKGYINSRYYVLFKDRTLMYAEKPQIYGSQIQNGYVWPTEDVENVDERRKQMNLSPMEDYLKLFKGITIVWDKNLTVEGFKSLFQN
jgi:hypothetical protein